MIEVDISNVWCGLSLPDLLAVEKDIAAAHETLTRETDPEESGMASWFPGEEELAKIETAARRIRENSEICVVLGLNSSALAARATIELLQGQNRNRGRGKGDPQILYAGCSLSTRRWNELVNQLEGKEFSVIALSRSGDTLEPAIFLRGLGWLLDRRCGTDEANRRVYVVTETCAGPLYQMARDRGWEHFSVPAADAVGISGLYAGELLPIAAAGIDIRELLRGVEEARESYDLRSFENPVWLYAGVRNALCRRGRKVEILGSQEPDFSGMARWWQRLFCDACGGQNQGLIPVPAEYPADFYGIGQLPALTGGCLQTMLRFEGPETVYTLPSEVKDLAGLNCLQGRTLADVDGQVFHHGVRYQSELGVPVITMDCGSLDAAKTGELIWFLQLACCISARAMGVAAAHGAGVVQYRRSLSDDLGRAELGICASQE